MKTCRKNSEKKYKQSLILNLRSRVAFLLLRKEEKTMAVVYATLIIKGKKIISEVPVSVKDQVKQVLIDMDLPELAE